MSDDLHEDLHELIAERNRLVAALSAAESARDTAWGEVDGLRADLAAARTVCERFVVAVKHWHEYGWDDRVDDIPDMARTWLLASVAATPASEDDR